MFRCPSILLSVPIVSNAAAVCDVLFEQGSMRIGPAAQICRARVSISLHGSSKPRLHFQAYARVVIQKQRDRNEGKHQITSELRDNAVARVARSNWLDIRSGSRYDPSQLRSVAGRETSRAFRSFGSVTIRS